MKNNRETEWNDEKDTMCIRAYCDFAYCRLFCHNRACEFKGEGS